MTTRQARLFARSGATYTLPLATPLADEAIVCGGVVFILVEIQPDPQRFLAYREARSRHVVVPEDDSVGAQFSRRRGLRRSRAAADQSVAATGRVE